MRGVAFFLIMLSVANAQDHYHCLAGKFASGDLKVKLVSPERDDNVSAGFVCHVAGYVTKGGQWYANIYGTVILAPRVDNIDVYRLQYVFANGSTKDQQGWVDGWQGCGHAATKCNITWDDASIWYYDGYNTNAAECDQTSLCECYANARNSTKFCDTCCAGACFSSNQTCQDGPYFFPGCSVCHSGPRIAALV